MTDEKPRKRRTLAERHAELGRELERRALQEQLVLHLKSATKAAQRRQYADVGFAIEAAQEAVGKLQ